MVWQPRDKWVRDTTAWRVLGLWMEEWPPICRVAANILNKQSRTSGKGWSSSLGVGRGANNSSLLKRILLHNIHRQNFGPGLKNEELHYLYSSHNIVGAIKSIRMRWARHVARMGEGRGVYRGLVGKPEGKRPLGRPRRRWEDNIKMDLQEMGCGGVD